MWWAAEPVTFTTMSGERPWRVMAVAGEASGEARAARLIEELRRRAPATSVYGIGGDRMREAGVEILVDSREMAVLGLFEVLHHFPFIYGVLRRMRRLLELRRPDLLILVDYSGFNLRLAKTAKALGIPVLYYISPQVWAWRRKRVFKIKQRVDAMAVVFPFEVALYEQAGVPVRHVGHPLLDEVDSRLDRDSALQEFGLDPCRPAVGLFPGSRRGELERLLPPLLEAADLLRQRLPEVQFLLPQASTLPRSEIDSHLAERDLPVTVVQERFYDVIRGCDAIATASGTATLEVALMGVPLVVVYKVAPLSYRIMRRLIRVEHVALCNIVADRRVAAELIQDEATPQAIADELQRLLLDNDYAATMRTQLAGIRERLGSGGASAKAAELALEMLEGTRRTA